MLRAGEAMEIEELREFMAGRFAADCLPRTINFAAPLPEAAVGKVLRREACRQ